MIVQGAALVAVRHCRVTKYTLPDADGHKGRPCKQHRIVSKLESLLPRVERLTPHVS